MSRSPGQSLSGSRFGLQSYKESNTAVWKRWEGGKEDCRISDTDGGLTHGEREPQLLAKLAGGTEDWLMWCVGKYTPRREILGLLVYSWRLGPWMWTRLCAGRTEVEKEVSTGTCDEQRRRCLGMHSVSCTSDTAIFILSKYQCPSCLSIISNDLSFYKQLSILWNMDSMIRIQSMTEL